MRRILNITICIFFFSLYLLGQKNDGLFRILKVEGIDVDVKYYELLVAKDGSLIATTSFIFSVIEGNEVNFFYMEKNKKYGIKNEQNIYPENPEDTIKAMDQSKDGYLFFVTHDNQLIYENEKTQKCDLPPFYFPPKGDSQITISEIWTDDEASLYIGTTAGKFYLIPKGAAKESLGDSRYTLGHDKDSSLVITKGEIPAEKIILGVNAQVHAFAQDMKDKNIIWIGTNNGLFSYNRSSAKITNLFLNQMLPEGLLTITHIEAMGNGNIWFSTLERGMGLYYFAGKNFKFFPYQKKQGDTGLLYPIKTFCVKTHVEFFVAVMDSLPAIFNVNSRTYKFITDPSFNKSPNNTTDIKLDSAGNLFLVKGGMLYSCNTFDNIELAATNTDSTAFVPFVTAITFLNRQEIASLDFNPQDLNKLKLKYNEASFVVYFNVNYSSGNKKIQFKWKAPGYREDWFVMPVLQNHDEPNVAYFKDVKPGKYLLQVKVKIGDGPWSKGEANVEIIITPPFWHTWWFWILVAMFNIAFISFFFWWRIKVVKKKEREKFAHEKQLLELEAKALRSQMNPHFIFNCMNSIKVLIHGDNKDKAVTYLSTFSKLLRTIFQNSDKREITLHDELETCRLYTELESLRFGEKLSYTFTIDKTIDTKSIFVPALILQPFIENAIWHGLMPKEESGNLHISVSKQQDKIYCIVEDDGIGRQVSMQNKFTGSSSTHESKGVGLTISRIELSNSLNKRNATVEIIDKTKSTGEAAGTKVIIAFNNE
ncbi:hypothetical protein BH10BAC3_BH10BAC3_27740 [soil metagenome]